MHKSILKLEVFAGDNNTDIFRTLFTTQHGRVVYLAVKIDGSHCTISDCFYTDRNQGKSGSNRYRARPQKLQTFQFHIDELLYVIGPNSTKNFMTSRSSQPITLLSHLTTI